MSREVSCHISVVKSDSFQRAFEDADVILTGIKCKYMSSCLVFSILPSFYEIKTIIFLKTTTCKVCSGKSFIDGNNLVKMATTHWKLQRTDEVTLVCLCSVFGCVHQQCMRLSSRNHLIDPDHVCGMKFSSMWVGSYNDFFNFDQDVRPKCRQTSGDITNMLSRLCQKDGKRSEEDKCSVEVKPGFWDSENVSL